MMRRAAVVVLASVAIIAGAGTAVAQTGTGQLIDGSPGMDSVVVRPPEEVALSFRVSLEDLQVRLVKDNEIVSDSQAMVEGGLAVATVETAGDGSYLVDWKGTDADGHTLSGAYAFLVDPRGTGSVAVEREIAGASGALGGMRVVAAGLAALGVVALLATGAAWLRSSGAGTAVPAFRIAAAVTAGAALAAGATYGIASDGSPTDLLDLSIFPSAAASAPGRAWFGAALTMGIVPLLLVLARMIRSRWLPIVAMVVGVTSAALVSVGLGWLLRLSWLLMAAALLVAVVFWVASTEGRPLLVAGSVVVGIAILIPVVLSARSGGVSSADQVGDFLIEASLDPARSGTNELHIYGFDVSGQGGSLGPTRATAYHPALDVGPLDVAVLRAGPNHFLSYHATLPLSGEWALQIYFETTDGEAEEVLMDMDLR